MVERFYNPELKGKFDGVEKFLYEVISKYKDFLDYKDIPHTRENLVRCMNFLMCGVWDQYISKANMDLNLVLRFENGDDILSAKIARGGDNLVIIYLGDEHIDDLYKSQIDSCEGIAENGDWEGPVDGKWFRYLYVPAPKTSEPIAPLGEAMPSVAEQKPVRELSNILSDLKDLGDKLKS